MNGSEFWKSDQCIGLSHEQILRKWLYMNPMGSVVWTIEFSSGKSSLLIAGDNGRKRVEKAVSYFGYWDNDQERWDAMLSAVQWVRIRLDTRLPIRTRSGRGR